MAKTPSNASPVAPGRLPDKDFFSHIRPADSKAPPTKAKKIPSREALDTLKAFGKGWDQELEGLLKMPERLFALEMEDARYYSSDGRFGLGGLISSMGSGTIRRPAADYGIALYSSAGTTYFLLADFNRRIIVRERLHCIHDHPPEKDWGKVKEQIKGALALADIRKKEVAIYDQGLGVTANL